MVGWENHRVAGEYRSSKKLLGFGFASSLAEVLGEVLISAVRWCWRLVSQFFLTVQRQLLLSVISRVSSLISPKSDFEQIPLSTRAWAAQTQFGTVVRESKGTVWLDYENFLSWLTWGIRTVQRPWPCSYSCCHAEDSNKSCIDFQLLRLRWRLFCIPKSGWQLRTARTVPLLVSARYTHRVRSWRVPCCARWLTKCR